MSGNHLRPSNAEVISTRPIQREDLPRLLGPRDKSSSSPKRLRESHHTIARFLATGITNAQIAALTGYSPTRVGQLASSPAMEELIALYRAKADTAWLDSLDAYYDLAARNMLKTERMIADRLEDAEEKFEATNDVSDLPSIRDLLSVSRDAADRFGYGKTQTNINKNVDFAAELEKRIARREGKVVELKPSPALPNAGSTLRRFG